MSQTKVSLTFVGGLSVTISEAAVLELQEHRRMCARCRDECAGCIRVLRCPGADRLVEKLLKASCP